MGGLSFGNTSVAFVGSDERGSSGWEGTYKRETIEVIISIKDEVTLHFVYLTYYAKNKSCTQFILRVPRTSLYLRE
jgi:hypothetical protein